MHRVRLTMIVLRQDLRQVRMQGRLMTALTEMTTMELSVPMSAQLPLEPQGWWTSDMLPVHLKLMITNTNG
jgi:hypothetical protein